MISTAPSVRRVSTCATSGATALLLLLFASGSAWAQAGRITGTVTDSAAGFPVSGVNVTVIGTNAGALSGDNGQYTV